jgi:hypothetical protein
MKNLEGTTCAMQQLNIIQVETFNQSCAAQQTSSIQPPAVSCWAPLQPTQQPSASAPGWPSGARKWTAACRRAHEARSGEASTLCELGVHVAPWEASRTCK